MDDYIIRAVAKKGLVRAFAITTKNTVNMAQQIHHTSAVVSAALGRTLTAASMMGFMLKDSRDLLTISFKGDGPIGGILATADNNGNVKGYPFNPYVDLTLNINGKLDVAKCIGNGTLSVMKDLGMKEPYVSQIPIVSGEIAEDIAHYFVQSEQIPTVVALGVLVDRNYSIKQSGGFIIQLMPGADDDIIDEIETNLKNLDTVTNMFESGKTPEDILKMILGEINILENTPVQYFCDCSIERVENALLSIGYEQLNKILAEDKQATLNCHFCNKIYTFTEQDLENLIKEL